MLHTPEAHEPLVDHAWSADAARAAIREIAVDCDAAFGTPSPAHWPMHPLDALDEDDGPYADFYLGTAGVVFALELLARRGLVERSRDWAPALELALEAHRAAAPADEWAHPPSLYSGEAGVLLTLHLLAPSAETAARLAALVAENATSRHRELMLGSPGTMLAARALGRSDLWEESAAALLAARDDDGLWTQHIYGGSHRHLGPAHGFAGCVAALAHRPDDELHRRASATVAAYAVEEDGLANWPPVAGGDLLQRDGTIRVQWCHGAPGMVASLARIAPDDAEHELLLVAGGELTWRAGPLVKGPGLCHGTAGNGLAFLALFERTGDELWLERARAFGMHAAAQVERARRDLGRGRYSLFTGDPGVALYLALCLDGAAALPGVDRLDLD